MFDVIKFYATVLLWAVFPCSSTSKKPLTPHGYKDATTNWPTIVTWLQQYPNCAWGIATNAERAVIDVDPRNGGDKTLEKLIAQNGPLPPTPRVKTGGGGWHYWLKFPPGTRCGKIADGIDLKAEGGYVIAAGSKIDIPEHEGRTYGWEVRPWEVPIAEAPTWLLGVKAAGAAKPEALDPWVVRPADDDLLTHPGSPYGERRKTLVRLVGIHLARGDSENSVCAMAEGWARRCQPPFEEWEKHVAGLSRKEGMNRASQSSSGMILPSFQGGVGEQEAEEEGKKGLSTERPMLAPAAYYGLFGDMLRAITPQTEADPAGVLLGFLACFGSVVGRGAWFTASADIHYPGLYVANVGGTGDAKGLAWGVVKYLFAKSDQQWAKLGLCNGVGSGQGLIERVRDESRMLKFDKKTGKVEETIIPGAGDKRCLLRLDELSVCFKLQRSDNSTLGETLLTAWGGTDLDVPNRNGNDLRATGYSIGVIGDTQPGTLKRLLESGKGVERFNGWLNRFLWCVVRSERDLPGGGNIGVLDPYQERLSAALEFAKSAGEMSRDTATDALWGEVYGALKRSGDAVPHTERARPYVMRLSMLYALTDCSAVIRVEHLRAALAVWDYCRESARLLFGGTEQAQGSAPSDPLWLQVVNAIRCRPGVSRSDVLRAFRSTSAEEMDKTLCGLEAQGLAYRRLVGSGGRPAECWWATGNGDGESGSVDNSFSLHDDAVAEGRKEGKNSENDAGGSFLPLAEPLPKPDALAGLPSFLPGTTGPASALAIVANSIPYADANAVIGAIHDKGGRVVKDDDGRCSLHLPKPDPELEAAFMGLYAEVCGEFLSYSELAELFRDL